MITPMTKYSFILLKGEETRLLEKLQEIGLVDVTRSSKPVDDTSQKLAGEVELLSGLIQGLGKADVPEGIEPEHIDGDIVRLAGGQIMRYSEDSVEIKALEKEVKDLTVWGSFDRAVVEELAGAGVPLHFHVLTRKQFKPEWAQEYALCVINEGEKNVRFVVAGEDSLPGEVPMPKSSAEEKKAQLEQKKEHFQKTLRRIAGAKERIPELEKLRREVLEKLDLYLAGVSAVPAAENSIVTLVGYAPTENEAAICETLDAMNVFYLKEAARAQDNPPVKLHNNWFARQFEVLTDMYGRPVYDEFDPTPILGPFFLLFFAMCMGDAGYGILLVLIGWFLKKKVPSMADMAPLVMMLGVGTFLVGIVLHTFFGINLYEAAWVPEGLKRFMISGNIAGYDAQMVLAVGVGIFHICLAMVVKTICYTQRFGFLKSLSTWGWTLLIVGTIVIAGLALLGVIDKPLVKILMIALGIVSGLGIFILNDVHRNPLLNIGSGLWDTYNTVTGLMGDVLSYLRLYALGLAGGMLGSTFNLLAGMTLDIPLPGVNWLLFAFIILIGHALNLALSCLGAFVHPLRLTFVEYFKNSGFEGTGRTYRPLKINKQ